MKALVVCLSFFLFLSGAASVQAAYLGEYCWQGDEGEVVRLAVNDMGGGHYLLNGRGDFTSGPSPMTGNAEVVGNSVYITLTNTDGDQWGVGGAISRIVLIAGNLGGTRESLSMWYVYGESSEIVHTSFDTGTLTRITCP